MPHNEQVGNRAGGWKRTLAEGLYETGLLRAFHGFSRRYELAGDGVAPGRFRKVRQAKYLVLGYHRVGVEGVPLYCTLPDAVFEAQMRHLARHYRLLSVRQMSEELKNPGVEGQGVVVTFDDGYLGTFTEAFPILRRYKIPATVYLTAGAIESGEISWYDKVFLRFQQAPLELKMVLNSPRTYRLHNSSARIGAATEAITYLRSISDEERQDWCKQFEEMVPLHPEQLRGAMMSWEQVRAMQREGISFGAHTMSHPVVSRLRPERLRSEIADSKSLIEQRLQSAVDEFAFPFGKLSDCGPHNSPILEELGFNTALTTITGLNQPGADPFRLRRIVIGDEPSIGVFAFKMQQHFFCPMDEEPGTVPGSAGSARWVTAS